jgi:ATP-dependent RNA helicase DHX37/DHR1
MVEAPVPQVIRVNRTSEIEEVRSKLPAVLTEQEIVDAIRNNNFSIICGDTGCGKSTQVPQFLYEAGFTEGANSGQMIAVTQPRRVAAVSVSERVGVELNNPDLVGYQVRYDTKINKQSMKIKFMTDGILLREIQQDIRIPQYSVVVIDEAHERSINCDMLLGLLSGSIRARAAMGKPLRVVIMSATLRMTDFTENKVFFPRENKESPAVVQIDNRMHPVTVHYERKTEEDYVPLIVDKINRIHKTLPQGGILVFVTGKSEVHRICNAFRPGADTEESETDGEDNERDMDTVVVEDSKKPRTEVPESECPDFNLGAKDAITEELTFKNGAVVETKTPPKPKPHTEKRAKEETSVSPFTGGGPGSKLRLFPLYAQMSAERQMEVFRANQDYPEDRIVVVATNVAETSLTIPNARFVIDSGREKRKEFNSNGVSRFAIRFTSRASANQRAGRAGRVGPGHVYRLFSPNVFGEHMSEFSQAEIETNPLDASVLFLRSMGVPSFLNFPWPTQPPKTHVDAAMKRLKAIGAISADKSEKVTEIGKQVSSFPVAPRLAVALIHLCLRKDAPRSEVGLLIIAAVSMLSVDCIADTASPEDQKKREVSNVNFSDDVELVVMSFIEWLGRNDREDRLKFCSSRGLNPKAMEEARSLFSLLGRQVRKLNDWKPIVGEWTSDPFESLLEVRGHKKHLRFVRECFTHSFVDQIAVREEAGGKAYRAPGCSDEVFINRASATYRTRPQFLAFSEMQQASMTDRRTMKLCFPVDPEFLATVDSPLIDRSKPHPLMRASFNEGRKIMWVVPRYIPLSITITDCTKVVVNS